MVSGNCRTGSPPASNGTRGNHELLTALKVDQGRSLQERLATTPVGDVNSAANQQMDAIEQIPNLLRGGATVTLRHVKVRQPLSRIVSLP
jgi:hypothetical protein